MTIPTREDLLEHFTGTFVISNVLKKWRWGDITWEQAMMIALLQVDEERKSLLSTIYTMKRNAHLSRTPKQGSQIQATGSPPPKTWTDYRQGCLDTYQGGYRTHEEAAAFRHGMSTVFDLLESELPDLFKETE